MLTPVLILGGLVLVLVAAVALTRHTPEAETFPPDRDPYEQWAASTVDADAWGALADRTRKDAGAVRPDADEPAPAPTPTFTPIPQTRSAEPLTAAVPPTAVAAGPASAAASAG
ncbi:hypothetical protein FraQA3DRAFT_0437, partial [Frankia sp. QA3]